MPRLFTGIEIPGHIADRLQSLRGGLPGARWIDPENFHVTLRFIGDIDDAAAKDIGDLLASIRRSGFSINLDGLGSFGGKRPRAVWARVAPDGELTALQQEIEQICQRAGLKPETRKYTPHVTLARLRGVSSSEVATYLSHCGDFFCPAISVSRFVLFSAKPSTGGGPYIVEKTYTLSEPPEAL